MPGLKFLKILRSKFGLKSFLANELAQISYLSQDLDYFSENSNTDKDSEG